MQSVKKIIKLHIQNCKDRENMVIAFANAGYHVWVEDIIDGIYNHRFFVCFELISDKESTNG